MTLKEFRQKKNKTKQQMADLIKLSLSMYEKLESGQRKPSVDTIKRFKEVFKDFDTNIFLN